MTLIIFDCDGVLVDSEIIALDMLAAALSELGLPHTFEETRTRFMGKSVKDVLTEIETMLGHPLPPEWGLGMNALLLNRLKNELRPVEGIKDAIAALPYPRCVASSSQPERIRLSLGVTGLAPFFGDRIFSATQVEHGKPAPDLFLYAAKTCGAAAAETIVIEDSPAGIAAAHRADMKAIGFAGARHADARLAEALHSAGAECVIDKMSDLPRSVESLFATCLPQRKQAP